MVAVELMASKDTEYKKQVGQRIVAARKNFSAHHDDNLTQVELAELVGVSQRSMQAYETGEVIPFSNMKAIADVLEVSVAWLLHGDEAEIPKDDRLEAVEAAIKEMTAALKRIERKL